MDNQTQYVKIMHGSNQGKVVPVKLKQNETRLYTVDLKGCDYVIPVEDCEPIQQETKEEQNLDTQYIKITDCSHDVDCWYYTLKGCILSYETTDAHGDYVPVKGAGRYVSKEDCEPYQFPVLSEGLHAIQQLTKEQIERIISVESVLDDSDHYKWLAADLRKDFPLMFAPVRTYKIGDEFTWEAWPNLTYRLALFEGHLVLVCGNDKIWQGNMQKVQDSNAVTESELELLIGSHYKEFSNLPNTTD